MIKEKYNVLDFQLLAFAAKYFGTGKEFTPGQLEKKMSDMELKEIQQLYDATYTPQLPRKRYVYRMWDFSDRKLHPFDRLTKRGLLKRIPPRTSGCAYKFVIEVK